MKASILAPGAKRRIGRADLRAPTREARYKVSFTEGVPEIRIGPAATGRGVGRRASGWTTITAFGFDSTQTFLDEIGKKYT